MNLDESRPAGRSEIAFCTMGKSKRQRVLADAFHRTNDALLTSSVDVNFSGTTVVSVIISGKLIVCSNAGDSRAILASMKTKEDAPAGLENESPTAANATASMGTAGASLKLKNSIGSNAEWRVKELSRDHKPDDPGEKERILDHYGRVAHYKDAKGNDIGPARVWLQTENIPGLAMSRSMGDRVAQSVGVSCEPELIEHRVCDEDKFIVIASDGVWEFLDNERVMKLVIPFWYCNRPDQACEKLVKEATARWEVVSERV